MTRLIALGTVSALLVLGAGCSSGPHVTSGPTGHGSSTSTSASVPPSTSTTLFVSPQVTGTSILSRQGGGDLTSDEFTIPKGTKAWDLVWSYDCSGAVPSGQLGTNVVFAVYKGGVLDVNDAVSSGTASSTQGLAHYSDTGRFSVHVNARVACTWTMNVVIPSG